MTVDEQIKAARQMVSDLCQQKRRWVMSVPARRDYDPDLVISGALDAAKKEIERLRILQQEQGVVDNEIVRAAIDGKALMSWVQQHQKLEQIEKILGSQDDNSAALAKIMALF